MFTYIKRIFLFLLTNFAVMALLGVIISVVGSMYPGLLAGYGGIGGILLYASIFGFGGAAISLFISRWQAKKMYNIILLEKEKLHTYDAKLQKVYETVERIAKDNSIDIPEVGYYESGEPNAFATGATKNSALVAVSTGLLDEMKDDEIRGVVGHEMGHILNGDMVTLTLITGVLNTFVIVLSQLISRIITSFLSRDNESEGVSYFSYFLVYNILQIIFGLLASIIIMWFSRIREYRADIAGSKFSGKSSMIHALKRLEKLTSGEAPAQNSNMKAFMITEPDSLFSTHPSLHNRIKRLEENHSIA